MQGIVKWYNNADGYGFLMSTEVKGDIYIHYSAMPKTLQKKLMPGDKVSFDYVDGVKGKQADNLVLIAKHGKY